MHSRSFNKLEISNQTKHSKKTPGLFIKQTNAGTTTLLGPAPDPTRLHLTNSGIRRRVTSPIAWQLPIIRLLSDLLVLTPSSNIALSKIAPPPHISMINIHTLASPESMASLVIPVALCR